MKEIGSPSEVAPIRRLLLKTPKDAFVGERQIEAQWRDLRYTARPDLKRAVVEHERLVGLLRGPETEILFLPADASTGLDSIYVRDAVVMSARGAVLCRMGKEQRRGEPDASGRFFETNGIPIAGRIEGEGRLEGGDVVFLDERTVAVGQGYRTNAEGIRQLRAILADEVDEVVTVPLPHWNGPEDVLHLMSLLSPIDIDLLLVRSRLLPTPFRQWLLARGAELLEVPDDEFATMGCNVLALAPGRCLMLEGNPGTRRLLQEAGCEVLTYDGREISFKGSGGPTCLTRPLLRR
ncbi:MAG TPA: arginine deiminase family protein [Candidatus Polarisedimenticolia bacterium]|nr:arginine deiminase family protein [Candidatus Polarisedimenticolia bacterium]